MSLRASLGGLEVYGGHCCIFAQKRTEDRAICRAPARAAIGGALPIRRLCRPRLRRRGSLPRWPRRLPGASGKDARRKSPDRRWSREDRKSTRLNSSHTVISYAVFCLKKKKNGNTATQPPA